jgi:gamma-glutamyltranspeptidase/glutathione hydrolase
MAYWHWIKIISSCTKSFFISGQSFTMVYTLTGSLRFEKDEAFSRKGLVTASTPQSAEAGLKMLRRGGNAIDSGAAMGFCNTVLEPYLASLSGLGFMLIFSADEDHITAIDFNTRASRGATPDMFEVIGEAPAGGTKVFEVKDNENSVGAKSVTIPATLAGLCMAHELYGRLPLQKVMTPAITLASDGFCLGWDQALILALMMREGKRSPEVEASWYPGGYTSMPGARIIQPELGRLLRRISAEGPGFVYQGDVADAVVKTVREGGGLLTGEDLASYEPVVSKPLTVNYRGLEITTVPTPSGGVTVLETLNILENFDISSYGHNSAEYLHILVEASRHAFADRYSFLGDWEVAEVPLEEMLSKSYAEDVARLIEDSGTAFKSDEVAEPWIQYLGSPIHDPWSHQVGRVRSVESTYASGIGETTHFNSVDSYGNAVCCTHTPGFQSGLTPPGTGLYLTSAMGWFVPKPGYPNSVAGWKRPLMNMAPLMVLRDGRPLLLQGAPGSRRIISRNLQVVLNMIEFSMGPQEAVAAPTVDASGVETLIDSRIPLKVVKTLERRGHRVRVVEEGPGMSAFARPSAVLIDREKGHLRGGVDLFRRSTALGL